MELKKRISLFLIISGLLIGGTGGWLTWNDLQAVSSSTAVTTPSWMETEKTPPHEQNKETEEKENTNPFTVSEERKTADKEENRQRGKQQENQWTSTPKSERAGSASVKASGDQNSSFRPSRDTPPSQSVSVISITGDRGHTILPPTSVKIQTGDTVFDILLRAVQKHGIQMEYQGSKSTLYVEGINNLYEFDRGSESGWMYRVNGVFPNKSAGVYTVHNQNRIEWLYTRDLGKDIGAKVP